MYRVLVADDEMIERKVLLKKLKNRYPEECEFYEAENGREVLRLYDEKRVQIMILDIEMPGITGLQAAEQIREKDPNVCIIFLTAFDDFSYAKKAISVHALDYLLKPYDEKELLLVMDAAMDYTERLSSINGENVPLPGIAREKSEVKYSSENEHEQNGLRTLMQEYVEKHYMEDISVQDIASALHYSEAYFCKLFKQYFDQNFVSYLSEYRIRKAKVELRKADANIKEIGKAVGYQDSNYFAKVFKRITGLSPSEYRMSEI